MYAIGVEAEREEVIGWTSTEGTSVERTGLSLITGQRYYFSVKARNEGGLWSTAGVGSFLAGVPCSRVYLPLVLRGK